MVVRDLAVDVVEYMRLRDAVGGAGTDPAHEAAEVAEQVTIERGKRTAGEGELGGTVVRNNGVSVLKERDQDQPVVDPVSTVSSDTYTEIVYARTRGKGQGTRGTL